MGTDIHLFVEIRNPDGTWQAIPPPPRPADYTDKWPYIRAWDRPEDHDSGWFMGKCYTCHKDEQEYRDEDSPPIVRVGNGCEDCMGTGRAVDWYHNRNYDVFAILADVRNGTGFAGCPTGKGFNIIAPPRGVPDDVSPWLAKRADSEFDHTPSWLTLAEILAFDWDQATEHYGVIPLHSDERDPTEKMDYVTWAKGERKAPPSYCGGISGAGIVTIDELEAKRVLEGRPSPSLRNLDDMALTYAERWVKPNENTRYYVRVSWGESYRESASDFLDFVERCLKPLGNPDDVRIVFGFDS